jgi:hypothetical protein
LSVPVRTVPLVHDRREQPGVGPPEHPGSGGAVAQPHDALFRFVFGKPVHTASELRAVLPPQLADQLDLANLRPVNGSFVDEELTNRHCDVLMRTTLDGREAFVYVLIEHQSSPDRMMPLRMLRYLMRIWERYLEEHPKAKRLPMIVPLVVYQGTRQWTHPVELSELLDVDPETARLAPVTTPVRLTVRLLRVVPTHSGGDAVTVIEPDDIDDFRDLQRYPDWRELMTAFLTYIQAGSETPPHRLAWLAAQIGPEAEEVYDDRRHAPGRGPGQAARAAAQPQVRTTARRCAEADRCRIVGPARSLVGPDARRPDAGRGVRLSRS